MALDKVEVGTYRREIIHARCGGTYLAHSEKEVVPDEGTCPVCKRVLSIYAATARQQIVATPGTPLAAELGLVVLSGIPGPAEGTETPVDIG